MDGKLEVRRSRSNFFFWRQVAFTIFASSFALLILTGVAVDTRGGWWGDFILFAICILGVALVLSREIIPALYDTKPLLVIDGEGVRAEQLGQNLLPWRNIAGYTFRFEWAGYARGWSWFLYLHCRDSSGPQSDIVLDTIRFDMPQEVISAVLEKGLSGKNNREGGCR